ncbi:uncharacterized protein [Coffea arabica]|uniref:Uncharacterized protein isoform X2 n=1 Tax=Coffea arabica TaxID=13443 RepID=A0ABM4VYA8_COFAR
MDVEFSEEDAATNAPLGPVWAGSPLPKLKPTPLFSSPSSSAAVISCPSSPPSPTPKNLSLLYEACGRTVNPVSGAVGLLSTGNWPVCEAAVETVLAGGTLRPMNGVGVLSPDSNEASEAFCNSGGLWRVQPPFFMHGSDGDEMMVEFESDQNMSASASFRSSEASDVWGSFGSCGIEGVGGKEPKLLNLFV